MLWSRSKDVIRVQNHRRFWSVCPRCRKKLPDECQGHDPCIENCPGTTDACCGHGYSDAAYVTLEYGNVLRGKKALDYFAQFDIGPGK